MKFNQRNLARYGLKASHILATATSIDVHWKKHSRIPFRRIIFVDGHFPYQIGYFELSYREWIDFEANRLSCVPPGGCAPMAGKRKLKEDAVVVHTGPVRSRKHFEEILDRIQSCRTDVPVRKGQHESAHPPGKLEHHSPAVR